LESEVVVFCLPSTWLRASSSAAAEGLLAFLLGKLEKRGRCHDKIVVVEMEERIRLLIRDEILHGVLSLRA
jgi:hypothetical protein